MAKSGVEFDTSGFLSKMKLANKKVREGARKQMNRNALNLRKEAVMLAPLDEGTLSGSGSDVVKSHGPRKTSAKWKGYALEASVGFNAPYAAEVHETMWPAAGVSLGRSGGSTSSRMPGKGTSGKPDTKFGPAGGKYLERPLLGMAKEYSKRLAAAIKKVLR